MISKLLDFWFSDWSPHGNSDGSVEMWRRRNGQWESRPATADETSAALQWFAHR